MLNSAIYHGNVRHRRLQPKGHAFNYRLFMLYLDLQELDHAFDNCRFFSYNKKNLAYLKRCDYIGPPELSLYQSACDFVSGQTGTAFNGRIMLLTHLRYFGFTINPISCYYCFNQNDELQYIIAAVTNTPWNETHHYLIPANSKGETKHQFAKTHHVSPFMPLDMQYHWYSNNPDKRLNLHLENWQNEKKIFDATLAMKKQPLTAKNLNRQLVHFPLMTVKIASAIYWQALKLALKGMKFYSHPKKSNNG